VSPTTPPPISHQNRRSYIKNSLAVQFFHSNRDHCWKNDPDNKKNMSLEFSQVQIIAEINLENWYKFHFKMVTVLWSGEEVSSPDHQSIRTFCNVESR
jgi:hypothetical protein